MKLFLLKDLGWSKITGIFSVKYGFAVECIITKQMHMTPKKRGASDLRRYPSRDKMEFVECKVCASKPGIPYLCDSCLKNRQTISQLSDDLEEICNLLEVVNSQDAIQKIKNILESVKITSGIVYVKTPQCDIMFPGIKDAWKDHKNALIYLESLGFNR